MAVALVAVLAWRVPPGTGTLGADVQVITLATGPLDLQPVGLIASGSDLRPGRGPVAGSVSVRNVTDRRQRVRLRAIPSGPDLDALLQVSVTAGGSMLYRGPLGGLRAWTAAMTLDSGLSVRLQLQAWLPAALHHGYQARIETVTLQWDVQPI